MKLKKQFYSEPFNEHGGQNCKGHHNSLTSDTFESEESREMLLRIFENYYPNYAKE